MENQTFIIIGGVAAGMSAASRIRRFNSKAEICVFEKNGYVSYAACGMPYLIAGKIPSGNDLITYNPQFFKEKRNIGVFLHHEVSKILPSQKTVIIRNQVTEEEGEYPYYRLLISTGARPIVPLLEGINLKGIFPLRKIEDGMAIQDFLTKNAPRRGLIIGAGNIGLEMAEAFSQRGLSVTVVEKMPSILGTMDDEIIAVVESELASNNVTLIKSKAVVRFFGDDTGVKGAMLEDGQSITADIVIIATGIRPNVEIAKEAGIELGLTGAIKVNDHMQTSFQGIYAAGDCAEAFHLVYQRNVYMPLGTTANKQGRVAGSNMAGGNTSFAGIVGTSVFKVFDLEVARTGLTEKDAEREGINYKANTIEEHSRARYYPGATGITVKLVADALSGRILGAQMVGKEGVSKRIDVFATAITAGMTAQKIEGLDLSYSPPFAPVYDPVLIAADELQKKLEK